MMGYWDAQPLVTLLPPNTRRGIRLPRGDVDASGPRRGAAIGMRRRHARRDGHGRRSRALVSQGASRRHIRRARLPHRLGKDRGQAGRRRLSRGAASRPLDHARRGRPRRRAAGVRPRHTGCAGHGQGDRLEGLHRRAAGPARLPCRPRDRRQRVPDGIRAVVRATRCRRQRRRARPLPGVEQQRVAA